MIKEMTNAEYRAEEGLASTDIKRMSKSFAYYKYCKDNPESGDTQALLFGRAYHKYCLEPYDFDNEFAVMKDFNCSSKAGKQGFIEYTENVLGRSLTDEEKKTKDSIMTALKLCGKDFIDESTMDKITEMRTVLYATPFCKKLLDGEHEKSIFYTDEVSGLKCKVRPDSYTEIKGRGICVDLKTCDCAETEQFMRKAINLGYDIQASHYVQGLKAEFGKDFDFVFIAQEKTKPYSVNILQADEFFMKSGTEVRADLLETYKKCLEKDEYPAYMGFNDSFSINSLSLPNWLKKAFESEVANDN